MVQDNLDKYFYNRMTPIGVIADAGSIPAISTISTFENTLRKQADFKRRECTYYGDAQVSTWLAK